MKSHSSFIESALVAHGTQVLWGHALFSGHTGEGKVACRRVEYKNVSWCIIYHHHSMNRNATLSITVLSFVAPVWLGSHKGLMNRMVGFSQWSAEASVAMIMLSFCTFSIRAVKSHHWKTVLPYSPHSEQTYTVFWLDVSTDSDRWQATHGEAISQSLS